MRFWLRIPLICLAALAAAPAVTAEEVGVDLPPVRLESRLVSVAQSAYGFDLIIEIAPDSPRGWKFIEMSCLALDRRRRLVDTSRTYVENVLAGIPKRISYKMLGKIRPTQVLCTALKAEPFDPPSIPIVPAR